MIERRHAANGIRSRALFSDCERYRYLLTRDWRDDGGRLLFVLLNPSTADERANDATLARCQKRAEEMGFGGFAVVNLFALRSPDPRAIQQAADPVGPENDATIRAAVADAAEILAGWGNHGLRGGRAASVLPLLAGAGKPLWSLGVTLRGAPRHPLYVARATAALPWN